MNLMTKKVLCGNEAIAQGAYEAGVRIATAYPGSPSSEIMNYLIKKVSEDFYAEWSSNEKVALEICFGASTMNQRSICSMKANGFNLCVDSLMSLTKKGIKGGLVQAVVDDPEVRYSDVNQDTTKSLENLAGEKNIPLVGKIPFDRKFTTSMVQGKTIIEYNPNGKLRITIEQIWDNICQHL